MNDFHFKHKDFLITEKEYKFYKLLMAILDDKYYIFPQIHLSHITKPSVKWTPNWGGWKAAFHHINQMSVDYVVCTKKGIRPKLAIELDDSSHNRADRIARDEEVEAMLAEAELPLARFTDEEAQQADLVEARLSDSLNLT